MVKYWSTSDKTFGNPTRSVTMLYKRKSQKVYDREWYNLDIKINTVLGQSVYYWNDEINNTKIKNTVAINKMNFNQSNNWGHFGVLELEVSHVKFQTPLTPFKKPPCI